MTAPHPYNTLRPGAWVNSDNANSDNASNAESQEIAPHLATDRRTLHTVGFPLIPATVDELDNSFVLSEN